MLCELVSFFFKKKVKLTRELNASDFLLYCELSNKDLKLNIQKLKMFKKKFKTIFKVIFILLMIILFFDIKHINYVTSVLFSMVKTEIKEDFLKKSATSGLKLLLNQSKFKCIIYNQISV